jgi:hypothetical protein
MLGSNGDRPTSVGTPSPPSLSRPGPTCTGSVANSDTPISARHSSTTPGSCRTTFRNATWDYSIPIFELGEPLPVRGASGRRVLEDQALPERATLVVGGVEAVGVCDFEYLWVGVDVAAEGDSAEAQPGVHTPEAESHPRRITGDGDGDPVTSLSACCRCQGVGIGVAADDAVHDHDVGGRGVVWVLGLVGNVALDARL